jgi:hypothetical protein
LTMILGGIELATTRRRERYAVPGNPPEPRNVSVRWRCCR